MAGTGGLALSILMAAAVVWLAGCQTTAESFQSACTNSGLTAGSAEHDACVQKRAAEMDRWNRIANRHRGGGP